MNILNICMTYLLEKGSSHIKYLVVEVVQFYQMKLRILEDYGIEKNLPSRRWQEQWDFRE